MHCKIIPFNFELFDSGKITFEAKHVPFAFSKLFIMVKH